MAGLLLFVILMCSFHEIEGQGHKPELSFQHFDGDYVLFSCSVPGSVKNDTRCNLYFGEVNRPILMATVWKKSSKTKQRFCQFTVPVDDLLRHLDSVRQKDASCDYRKKSKHNSLSPRSDQRSLTDVVARESSTMGEGSTFTITTGLVPASLSPTYSVTSAVKTTVKPTPGSNTAAGSTVTTPSVSTSITSVNPTSGSVSANLSPTENVTSAVQMNPPSRNNASATSVLKLFILVAGFGVSVVVILLVLVLRRHLKRRTDRSSHKTKVNIKDDSVCMRNINYGGVLPAGNNDIYSLITSVPGADCSAGFEKLNRQEPQTEDSDIYHMYSTIPEQPTASDPQDMLYSLLQAH